MEQKQKYFTYILGAGASADTIPVVKKFNEALDLFIDEIDTQDYFNTPTDYQSSNIKTAFKNLHSRINDSASIDTYIKKLDLSSDSNRLYTRELLSSFIHYLTLTKPIDKRYDLFCASIFDKDSLNTIVVPNNIKVISWNYDRLLETSIQSIYNTDSHGVKSYINVFDNVEYEQPFSEDEKFEIIKLNGSAGYYIPSDRNCLSINDVYERCFDGLKSFQFRSNERVNQMLRFAWDNDKIVTSRRKRAIEIMKNTSHLIIIGYSYPTFNRMIDYELLSCLPTGAKIHLQIPEESILSVKQRLEALLQRVDIEVLERTEVDEFYIPYEFNIPIQKSNITRYMQNF